MPETMQTKAVAEWIEEARELGRTHARSAASWIADGNTSEDTLRNMLRAIEEGDPRMDEFMPRRPDLSGEFADDPTPSSLAADLIDLQQLADEMDPVNEPDTYGDVPGPSYAEMADIEAALADAYEEGVSEVFETACETEIRNHLGN